jgi:hypothetical protein
MKGKMGRRRDDSMVTKADNIAKSGTTTREA